MGNSNADAAAFRAAVVNGQLGVDPDAAQVVLKKIRTGKDSVENLLRNAGALAEPPKLGANPVGDAMATKFSQRADGGSDSYAQALQNLYTQYDQAEQAIVAAMNHYHRMEQEASDAFSGNQEV